MHSDRHEFLREGNGVMTRTTGAWLDTVSEPRDTVCRVCGTAIILDGFGHDGVSYCCERCYVRERFLGDALNTMSGTYLPVLEALVEAIDAREHEVGNHSYRVTQFAMVLARRMEITGQPLVSIYCGSLLHDIGKIGIPDAILHKHGSLTAEEKHVMQAHPEIGHRIISHIGYLAQAAQIVYAHHEPVTTSPP